MSDSSVRLIHRILDGEEEAFTELVQRYQKKIHALAWWRIKDFHIAEEITQDVFLQVYEKLPSLKNPKLFEGWLYVITNRLCLNWLKKNRIEKGHLNIESLEDTPAKEKVDSFYTQHQIEQREKDKIDNYQKIVNTLLELLPESERTVIILYYLGQMTTREIGKFLGVSVNTIKSHLRRARNRLKEEEELLLNENLGSLQLSKDLTESIIEQIANIKPTPPVVKPVLPWVTSAAAAVTAVLVLLLIGTMSKYLALFQKPFDFETLSKPEVEIVESPINDDLISLQSVQAQDPSNWHLPEGTIARLGKGTINEIQYSPDGKILAAATDIGIWLYDTDTYKEIALLASHTESIRCLDFNADGSMLAAGAGHKIVLWDMSNHTQKSVIEVSHARDVLCVAFSPDSKSIASGTHGRGTFLYDVETGIRNAIYWIVTRKITGVEFSPDGQFLLIEGTDLNRRKTISLRDTTTGKEIRQIICDDSNVNGVAFSPDGKLIASTSSKKARLLLWDPENLSDTERNIKFSFGASWSVAFSPDSKLLAIGGIRWVMLYDPNAGKQIGFHTANSEQVFSLAFSPDGKTLASATTYQIHLWDIDSAQPMKTINSDSQKSVKSVAISPDGSMIASGGLDESLTIFDAATGNQKNKFDLETGAVNTIAFSSDGNTIAVGAEGIVYLLDIQSLEIRTLPLGHVGRILSVMFSPDLRTLACGGDNAIVVLIDVDTEKQKTELQGHEKKVNSVVFNPDGTLLASGGDDERVILWDANTGRKVYSTDSFDTGVLSLTFSPDGKTLTIGGRFYRIGLLDVNTHELSTFYSEVSSIAGLSYSADGKILVIAGRSGLHLWDMEKGNPKSAFIGHQGDVTCVKYNPIDGSIVSGGDDGTIRIWNNIGGEYRNITTGFIETVLDVEYSPDGNTFATTGGSYAVRLWDAKTNKLKTAFGSARATQTIAFSPDGNQIATGGLSDNVYLWDTNTRQNTNVFEGHKEAIECIAYSPDGKTIVSGCRDGLIILWDLTNGKEKKRLTAHLIGHDEWVRDIEYSPDGKSFASASDEMILLWNLDTYQFREFSEPADGVQCIAFHPYGSVMASGHYESIFLWHVPTGKQFAKLEGHTHTVTSIAFSPDGKILASGGGGYDDKNVILWDIATTKEITRLKAHTEGVSCVAFSADGNTLLSGSLDGTLLVWDISEYR